MPPTTKANLGFASPEEVARVPIRTQQTTPCGRPACGSHRRTACHLVEVHHKHAIVATCVSAALAITIVIPRFAVELLRIFGLRRLNSSSSGEVPFPTGFTATVTLARLDVEICC